MWIKLLARGLLGALNWLTMGTWVKFKKDYNRNVE